jgi:hypothetical protein
MNDNPTDYQSRRYREMLLVRFALNEMRGIRSKDEVLRYIRSNGWLAPTPQDKGTYESKNESKSDTLLCYARLNVVEAQLMFHHDERDHWEITRMGQDFLESEKSLFSSGTQKVRHCYMWTQKFKTIFDAAYVPTEKDWVVPDGRSFINEYLG